MLKRYLSIGTGFPTVLSDCGGFSYCAKWLRISEVKSCIFLLHFCFLLVVLSLPVCGLGFLLHSAQSHPQGFTFSNVQLSWSWVASMTSPLHSVQGKTHKNPFSLLINSIVIIVLRKRLTMLLCSMYRFLQTWT